MYTQLALDQVRMEQERRLRRAECALRWSEQEADQPTHRHWPRRFHRRPATAC